MCDAPAIFFAFRRYFELYFVFLMSSGRLVWLFSGSPEGSRGNKRTWLPGMAASQTFKGRHKEAFWSRVHVYINHRYSESHRCESRAQASISVKSVLSVFEKKNKKQIYPIYLISIPKTCRASISDTSDTSASLITSASEIICLICGRLEFTEYNLLV